MLVILIVLIVLLAVLVFGGLLLLGIYNGLIRARVRAREAWSGIDVQLKRRASLIPNLVETVKGYASHEQEVLENVTRALLFTPFGQLKNLVMKSTFRHRGYLSFQKKLEQLLECVILALLCASYIHHISSNTPIFKF